MDNEEYTYDSSGAETGGSETQAATAEIFAHDVWINNDGGDPVLKAGQPFTMMAEVCNQGPAASGVFTMRFVLDSGADSTELEVPNLDAGQCIWMSWPYPSGVSEGDHQFEAYFDIYNIVPGDDPNNNYNYYGFNIASAPTSEYAEESFEEYA